MKTTGFGSWQLQNTKNATWGLQAPPWFLRVRKTNQNAGTRRGKPRFCPQFYGFIRISCFLREIYSPPIPRRTNQYSDSSHGQMALKQEKSCSDADQNAVSLTFFCFLPVLLSKTGKHQPPGVRRLSTTNGIFVVVRFWHLQTRDFQQRRAQGRGGGAIFAVELTWRNYVVFSCRPAGMGNLIHPRGAVSFF